VLLELRLAEGKPDVVSPLRRGAALIAQGIESANLQRQGRRQLPVQIVTANLDITRVVINLGLSLRPDFPHFQKRSLQKREGKTDLRNNWPKGFGGSTVLIKTGHHANWQSDLGNK